MKYQILDSYLSESERLYYEKVNPGWKVNTGNCLSTTFDDGTSTTYVIFEGPWTKSNICRNCGMYYERSTGNQNIKLFKSLI